MNAEGANVINFPVNTRKRSRAKRDDGRVKNIDGVKYFNDKQIKMIRRAVRDQNEIDEKKGKCDGN